MSPAAQRRYAKNIKQVEAADVDWEQFDAAVKLKHPSFVPKGAVIGEILNAWSKRVLKANERRSDAIPS